MKLGMKIHPGFNPSADETILTDNHANYTGNDKVTKSQYFTVFGRRSH